MQATAKLQASLKEECYFMEIKEEVRRGCFEGKPIGEEIRVIMVSHWLSCRAHSFLVADAMDIFSC